MAAGDTYNEIRVRLLDRDGKPVDLTGRTVTWNAEAGRRRLINNRTATAYTNGEVGIKFTAADRIPKGPLYLTFQVDWGTGIEHFPSHNDLLLHIT